MVSLFLVLGALCAVSGQLQTQLSQKAPEPLLSKCVSVIPTSMYIEDDFYWLNRSQLLLVWVPVGTDPGGAVAEQITVDSNHRRVLQPLTRLLNAHEYKRDLFVSPSGNQVIWRGRFLPGPGYKCRYFSASLDGSNFVDWGIHPDGHVCWIPGGRKWALLDSTSSFDDVEDVKVLLFDPAAGALPRPYVIPKKIGITGSDVNSAAIDARCRLVVAHSEDIGKSITRIRIISFTGDVVAEVKHHIITPMTGPCQPMRLSPDGKTGLTREEVTPELIRSWQIEKLRDRPIASLSCMVVTDVETGRSTNLGYTFEPRKYEPDRPPAGAPTIWWTYDSKHIIVEYSTIACMIPIQRESANTKAKSTSNDAVKRHPQRARRL